MVVFKVGILGVVRLRRRQGSQETMAIEGGGLRERMIPFPGRRRSPADAVIDRRSGQNLRFGNQFEVHIAEGIAILG